MMSTVYRQDSVRNAKLDRIDPDNKLLGRMPVRRLDAEIVRDALLSMSGKLNAKQKRDDEEPKPDQKPQPGPFVEARGGI